MALGDDIKTWIDTTRNTLGSDCTLGGTTALGKCAVEDLSPARTREFLGNDYEDEISLPWAMIEVPAASAVVEGSRITVDITSTDWIVRRVMRSVAAGVLIAKRCICHGELQA